MSNDKQPPVYSHRLPVRLAGSNAKPGPVESLLLQMIPADILACQQIAYRLRDIAKAHRIANGRPDPILEMNPAIIGIDVAIVHCLRDLDLRRMLNADELALIAEHGRIQKNIVRTPLPFFPAECMLEFARKGARKSQ